ncbi:M1 family peptidase [Nakamurella antarctica]|uniref:Aminopeptidase N n=1 Tax=Nakamurella antarctica TaxID=1902245 RepID=A0A3G8ZMD7_9ACTN|nr:M1 family metallopeptidase [Nakamurella antarctica]AZI58318.1 M1 family peptidase [Nakamurella antarctica]
MPKLSITAAAPGAATAGDPYVALHGNGGYRVTRYDLTLTYRMSSNRLVARAEISAVATQPLTRFTLDLAGLRVSKVSVNSHPAAKFTQPGRKLHIWPAMPLAVGAAMVVVISYSGNPGPIGGRWGQVGWEELDNGVIVAGQPTGAPTWFPCNDHPSDKASFRIGITTDSPYYALANGVLTDKKKAASQTTWVYEQQEPMATYLATVQIGEYEMVELTSKPVPTRGLIPTSKRSQFKADFGRQGDMVAYFGSVFGPYPFAAYTVVVTADDLEIPLEAQGLSIFGANYLDGKRGQERLVAHELAHQWFGNSLTVSAWQHIWLNEGFACYAEWLWAEHSGGTAADVSAIAALGHLRKQRQDLILTDPGPELMFDDRVYKRGALTLHAVRKQLGNEQFFLLLRDWVASNRYSLVNTDAFLAIAQRYGVDLEMLQRWLFQAPLPDL